MKKLFLFILLSTLCFIGCQSDMPVRGGNAAVRNVIIQKECASLDCARILIDQSQIVSIHLHGLIYFAKIKKIDVNSCPEDFCAAWSNYLAAWKQKLAKDHATRDSLDIISMYKGNLTDLPTIAIQMEAYDTVDAWNQCEKVASRWGVNPREIKIN